MSWWWLSFCAQDDGRNLGIALVHAHTADEANLVARILGCRPLERAELLVLEVPPSAGPPPTGYTHRLLGPDEMRAMQAMWTPDEPEVKTIGEFADDGDPAALRMLSEDLAS